MAHVLIVDDNLQLALTLATCVESQGHQATTASNGKEAVECFRKADFDIAFMDVQMPIMNGIDSFFEIRKVRPTARIVLMTGTPQPSVQQAVLAGALALLLKPFKMTDVLALLQSVIAPTVL